MVVSLSCAILICIRYPKKSLLKPVNYLSNALGNDLMFCFVHVLNFFPFNTNNWGKGILKQ